MKTPDGDELRFGERPEDDPDGAVLPVHGATMFSLIS
jgi:hypothetical protein